MKNRSWAAGSVSFVFRALLGGMLVLSLSQCGVEQGEAGENLGTVTQALEHCGGVACAGNADCTLAANMPVCASAIGATCLTTTPRECAWKLNISSSCPCMEHAVRLCTQSNGSPGVQICTANGNATYWASCIACPSCST